MRIAIIYNEPRPAPPGEHWLAHDASDKAAAPQADASELGVLDEVAGIDELLRRAGHESTAFAVRDVSGVARFLEAERPNLIFNACESLHGDDSLTMAVAGLFDLFGIPYTGSAALTLGLALDKSIAKALFRAHDVPTPAYVLLEQNACIDDLELQYPLIVKPVREDASNGITAGSVVTDADQLSRRARFIWQAFDQAALVEEYIDGRELNVALLATSPTEWLTLPISEIAFEGFGDQPRIVCYESKWVPGSAAYDGTVPLCPATLPEHVAEEVRATALRAAQVIGLRDYGRIDLRLRAGDDAVFVLEANPNPDISRDAGFMRAAAASGRTHADTICEIVARAAERARLSPALDRAS
jgi:D-alanine-D-alanine ligase